MISEAKILSKSIGIQSQGPNLRSWVAANKNSSASLLRKLKWKVSIFPIVGEEANIAFSGHVCWTIQEYTIWKGLLVYWTTLYPWLGTPTYGVWLRKVQHSASWATLAASSRAEKHSRESKSSIYAPVLEFSIFACIFQQGYTIWRVGYSYV